MQTSVHNVLIGKQFVKDNNKTIPQDLKEGDLALFDQDGKLITKDSEAAAADMIRVGVKEAGYMDYSMFIQKAGHPRATLSKHQEPQVAECYINFGPQANSPVKIVVGHRYVVRIVYKDLDINHYQFAHQYEVYANSESIDDLINAFVKKINKHAGRRVTASFTTAASINGGKKASDGKNLKLTALNKDDEGVDGLNEYSIVSMEVTFYRTIPGALLNNQPESVPGVTIINNGGTPGVGFWKQVRDKEVRNMGYKGHVFTGAYPSVEPDRKTVEGAQYDSVIIDSDNVYLSNDNQYIKTTPMTVEVYCPNMVTDGNGIGKLLAAFISGEAQTSEAA